MALTLQETMGLRITAAREKVAVRGEPHMTQVRAAACLKMARQTYLDIESGKTRVKADTLLQIALLFKVNLLWLYGLDDPNHDSKKFERINELARQIRILSI